MAARVGVGEAAGEAGWVKAMLRSTGAAKVAAWAVDLAVSKLRGERTVDGLEA